MNAYPDPSIVIAAFVNEPHSELAATFLGGITAGALVTSWWTDTEVVSALAIKARTGGLSAEAKPLVLARIRAALARSATIVSAIQQDFRHASAMIERCGLPLRAGDAMHLAIADREHAALWTLDRKMADAGQALGIDARLLV